MPTKVMAAATINARPMPVTKPVDSFGVSVVYPPLIIPETTWYGMAVVMMYATRPMLTTLPVLKRVALIADATPRR
jgi:hypothetical protein